MAERRVWDLFSSEQQNTLRMAIFTRVDFINAIYRHDLEARKIELLKIADLLEVLGLRQTLFLDPDER